MRHEFRLTTIVTSTNDYDLTLAEEKSTAALFGEIRYAYLREDKLGFEIARAAIEAEANLPVIAVNASLAVHAAELRRHYSRKNVLPIFDFRLGRASER